MKRVKMVEHFRVQCIVRAQSNFRSRLHLFVPLRTCFDITRTQILLEVRLTPLLYDRRGPVRQLWRLEGLWIVIARATALAPIAHLAHSELFATIVESKPEAMDSIGREVRDTIVFSVRSRHSLAGNHCLLVTTGYLLDAARHLCACVQFVLDDQHHVVVLTGSLDWAR